MKVFQKKIVVYLYPYNKWDFQPKISSIFHFEQVNDGWNFHILCVRKKLEMIATAFYCGNSKSALFSGQIISASYLFRIEL